MPIPFWAGRYIGIAFKDRGRDRGGVDCWGLVRLVMAEQFGTALPSYATDYDSAVSVKQVPALIARAAADWRTVRRGEEKLGDVIVLRLQGHPLHVGLVLGDCHMLHVERGINSAIEKYSGPRWAERIHGIYRRAGMEK